MQQFSHGNQDTSSQRSRKRFSPRGAPLLILFAAILLAALSFRLGGATTARAATFNLVWSDEFGGAAGTGVNTSNWIYDTGTGFGTGEIETMTTSTANVSQDGAGHLKITAIRDSSGNWTSGRIETQRDDFAAPAGGELEITASLQQPNVSGNAGLGYWPAFWTLGTPYRTDHSWPKDGEVDIMEDVNGLSSVYGTLHCGVDPGGPCNETSGIGSGQRACSGCQTSFHTYTEIIDRSVSPEQIRWYLDGNNYFTVSANQVDATTWANAVDHAFYVIFDLAMGGGFPNGVSGKTTPTSSTQSGASMLVDYVRVYTANGSAPSPTPTTAHTPTPTPTSSGCTGTFTQGVNSASSSSAQFWFKPCGWTAGYVILHYVVPGQVQQNVQMTYNSSTARWEYTAGGMSPGQTITYSFTYQQSGLQHDTSTYTWTHP
ncbi:MAG TPA: glycoside hydrolase family 16 protein [Ktedonobacterales bacterium]|nr:glycoside hydrolase family 16 protein [Ktedonobacterales bacterium]